MRTLQLAGSVLAFAAAFAAHGCVLDVSGLEDPASNAGGASGTMGTGGAGVSVTSTASSSTGTGCEAVPEICNDGDDNDCNGMTDCADPACTGATGYSCTPVAPAGWTVVAFAASSPPACPAGFENPTVVAPPPAAGAKCACACDSPSKNPCTQGTLSITVGMDCKALAMTLQVTGDCQALPAKINSPYGTGKAQKLDVTPVACSGKASLPAAPPSPDGVTCTPVASSAKGCEVGSACLPEVTAASLCIQREGDIACPGAPFTKRHLVGAPGDVTDQRTCGTCSCTSSATSCNNATFIGYDNNTCSMGAAGVAIDGTCHETPSMGTNFDDNTHFIYSATPNTMSCAPSGNPAAVSGAFKLNNPTTICCQ